MLANSIRHDFDTQFAYDEKYFELINQFGFETFPCENFNAQRVLDDAKNFSFDWMNEHDLKQVFLSQVDCINKLKPHAVIGDAAFTLKMAAEKANVKMIAIINGYMSVYYSLTRKLPRKHFAQRYSEKIPESIFDRITRTMEQLAFKKVHAPFRTIRKDYGLSPCKNYLNELTGDYTLICDLPQMFPQKKLPFDYDFIGPLFFQSEEKEKEIISSLNRSKPTVLISLGSSGEWSQLECLSSKKFHGFNIITAGDEYRLLQGPHVISKKFLNNNAVLPFVDVMICHGGNGTIYQALAHGVPVLGLTSIFEQEWNMNRIRELTLGEFINNLDEDELYKKIVHWIQHDSETNFVNQISQYNSSYHQRVFSQSINQIILT